MSGDNLIKIAGLLRIQQMYSRVANSVVSKLVDKNNVILMCLSSVFEANIL